MRQEIISTTVEAKFDQIECSFLQKTHGSYIWCANKIFSGPKFHFWGAREAFFSDLIHFSEIEDYFKN